jgi:amidohydrolase
MQEKAPGCYFFIGSNNQKKHPNYGHHHPKFDFDEEALVRGTAWMTAATADTLKNRS